MSQALSKLMRAADERRRIMLRPEEQGALRRLEREAARSNVKFNYPIGSRLAPSCALGILRRGGFRCGLCGGGGELTVILRKGTPIVACTNCSSTPEL